MLGGLQKLFEFRGGFLDLGFVDGGEFVRDAGPAPIAQLVLRRTPTGFVGVASADAGACAFPARIIACEPGALVLVYGSTRLGAPLLPPVVEQPVWIDPTTLFLADVALAAASGQTTFAYPVPGVAALVGAQFWLQGVGGTSFPLQTSPPVGGIVR